MAEFYHLLGMLDEVIPSTHDSSLKEIIELNQGKMNQLLAEHHEGAEQLKIREIRALMNNEEEWKVITEENIKRTKILKLMMSFRATEHLEMLNLSKFREIITVEGLKEILTRQIFLNFTINEKQVNKLLNIQGYFLKNFIYFHMRHDMRFKATIDSATIDMDNPYNRNTIRVENKEDPTLKAKYITGLGVEDFCITLLDRFFPDIAGIWAEHSHNAPYYILEFIKLCFEFGFISTEKARQIMVLLVKTTSSLIKLEEGWLDRLNEVNKLSDMFRANNITNLFAKCRENMAYILIQIIVLLSDVAFVTKYPKFVAMAKEDPANPGVKKIVNEADMEKVFFEDFAFYDSDINDGILYITMNYLSNTIYISFQKGLNHESKSAVEKIFLFMTSTHRDIFLNSLKKIKVEDLKYFEDHDVVSKQVREDCDDMGITMRKLLELLGQGVFDKFTGNMIKDFERDENYVKFLRPYVPTENPSLGSIISRLLRSIDEKIRLEKTGEDYKAGLVKESIPLAMISLIDYITEYFEKEVQGINRDIYSKLNVLCNNNNYCKAQLFKGDALYHLRKLLHRLDKDTYLFISNLCLEDNITFFLGGEVFTEFLKIYEKFNNDICKKLNNDDPTEGLDIENCTILLIMTKIITKIFKRPFLNEREKLQYALMAQEIIYPDLEKYIRIMLMLLNDSTLQSLNNDEEMNFTKNIFMDESESELINRLESKGNGGTSLQNQKILLLHVCFNVLRAFNMVCSDCFSSIVQQKMVKYCATFRNHLFGSELRGKKWVEPFGLDVEIVNFIKMFEIFPEQNCIIENEIEFESLNKVDFKRKEELKEDFVSKCIDRVSSYMHNSGHHKEGQVYMFEALFPLVYKYVKTIQNMTNFDKTQQVATNMDVIKKVMGNLNDQISNFNKIVDKVVVAEEEFTVKETGKGRLTGQIEKSTILDGRSGVENRRSSQIEKYVVKKEDAKPSAKSGDTVSTKQNSLLTFCDKVISFMEEYYDEEQDHKHIFDSMKDISRDRFTEMIYAAKFEEKPSTELLITKKKVLNSYIKLYQMAKEEYFIRAEEPNLMSYFDRNTQNLRGVFNSCLDRMLNRTKLEKASQRVNGSLSTDYAMSRFWLNPSCYAYINMLERLLTQSKTARKEFYQFIKEDRICAATQTDDYAGSKKDKEANGKLLQEMRKYSGGRFRDDILSVIIRIHTDLLIFLNSNSSLRPLWWVTHQTYEMISMFFKNLCECNFMDFKKYFGEHKPTILDKDWEKLGQPTIMEVFVKQLNYLNNSCRISKNKEPIMVHSDQINKMQPIMAPLINVINEAVTGPCQINQKILMESPIDGLINIAMRVIDQMDSNYSDLAEAALTLMLSMSEGYNEEILKTMAIKIPSSILVDRLYRLTKKIYIKELIESKQFEQLALEKLKEEADKEKAADPTMIDNTLPGGQSEHLVLAKEQVTKALEQQDFKEKKFIITEDMESMVDISDWEDLFDLYMKRQEFSESKQFHYIFKIMILWQTLAPSSRNHKSRLDDAKYETELYFGETDFFEDNKTDDKMDNDKRRRAKPTEFSCIFYFISNKIMTEIEVVDPMKNPVSIYFPRAPQCYMLSEEAKRSYREECDITDSNTKMLNLMRNFKMFNITMSRDLITWRKIGFFFSFLSSDAFKAYTYLCWLLGLALNVVIAAGMVMDEYGENLIYRSDNYESASRILAYILVGISSVFLFIWFLFKYKQTYLTRLEDYLFDHPGTNKHSLAVKFYVAFFSAFIYQPFPMGYTLHIIFSVIGIEYATIALALNLLLIINISTTTKFVLKAILLHIDQLVLTLILAIFVIFTYSMILGNVMHDFITEENNSPCESLVECFFFTVNLGLRNGGGISDSLTQANTESKFGERTIFDITFFMLINVISLNIIFGIIIDTFSQLRDAQYERVHDFRNNCFVCGNTRLDFSKLAISFDDHISVQHDPWKYIYYILYLKNKGESELSGLEYFAWTQIQAKKTNWIPIGNTKYISSDNAEQLNALDEKMNTLDSLVGNINKNIMEVYKSTEEVMKARGLSKSSKNGHEDSRANLHHKPTA